MSYQIRLQERDRYVSIVWEADSSATMPPSYLVSSGDKCITLDDGALYLRDGRQWVKVTAAAAGATAWGAISGTLSSQTDLQSALDLKAASVHAHVESDITGLVADLAGKQPIDSDLTTIAGLTSTTDNFMVAAASAWASRTPAQAKTSLALVKADVALGNVDNTSDAGKPVSTAQQTALDLKQNLDADLTAIAGLAATTDNVIQAVASAWASRTPAQLKATLALVKGDVGLGNVDNTADTAKPISTAEQTALDLKANLASPTFSGTPLLPTGTTATTQSAADSSTKLATTAFATTADNLKANLASPTFTGTVTVPGLTINDATDLTINTTTGSKIGQAGSKIGFFGIAPVVRPSALTQTYSTASATHAAVTSSAAPAGGVGAAAGGWSTAANRDLAIATINADRTDLVNLKNFVNQIVDQLQALGILQ